MNLTKRGHLRSFAGYPQCWADSKGGSILRRVLAVIAVLTLSAFAEPPLVAKVAIMSLAELAEDAEFIGIVRVDRISWGIPFLKSPRATATILQSWKGQSLGRVTFVAAPTWTCDISDAKKGEEAVVFIRGGSLEHSGRGRMPIFTRDGRKLAAIWPDVRLPQGTVTEDGPEPAYQFIRAIDVVGLRDAVAPVSTARSDAR